MPPESVDEAALRKASAEADAAELARDQAAASLAKANADNAAAAGDRLTTRLTGVVPKFSDLAGGSVTLPAGAPFRGAETAALALRDAASTLAAVKTNIPDGSAVLLTADTNILQSLANYVDVSATATTLDYAASDLLTTLKAKPVASAPPKRFAVPPGFADTALSVGDAAAAAVKEVASLFVVDSTIESHDTSLSEFETHAAVLGALLKGGTGATRYFQDHSRSIRSTSALLTTLRSLTGSRAALQAAKDGLAAAQKSQSDDASALIAKIDAFVARIEAVPTDGSPGVLATALEREDLMAGTAFDHVLIVPAATVSTDQIAVKRRLLNPRVVVSGFAHLAYLLVRFSDGAVVAAGSATGASAYRAKFADTVEWNTVAAIGAGKK